MSWRTRQITRELKAYDKELYAKEENGKTCVYRNTYRYIPYQLEGETFKVLHSFPWFCFALTHDWSFTGQPVDRGLEQIMHKVRFSDPWRDGSVVEEAISDYEKRDEAKRRENKSLYEDIAAEARRDFAKATNDIVVRH